MTERNGDPVRPAGGPGGTRGRWIPALLTVVVPGLGHAVAGRRRLAAVFGLPVVFALFFAAGLAFAIGTSGLLGLLLDEGFIVAFLALQALLLAWRLVALRSSLVDPRQPRLRVRDALPVALLVLAVVVPQAYAGYVTNAGREAVDEIVAGGDTTTGAWKPSLAPGSSPSASASLVPGETPSPGTPSPSPSPTPTVPRINVLLIGVDAGVGRTTYLTDTMIVASIDPLAGTVSLLSIPRDLVDVPLPDGRKWSGKINSLLAYARNHPTKFPGSDGSGHDVLMAAIGTLLGIEIDYYAQVNLAGFVAVVDRLGGVDVNVARRSAIPATASTASAAGSRSLPGGTT